MPYIRQEKPFDGVARLVKGRATGAELGRTLGVSANTARRRMNNPEELTLGEIKRISQRLHIPADELRSAIKW